MKQSVKVRILGLVTSNKITKFVAKLLGMSTAFQNGDIVCLKHDITRRFIVKNNILVDGNIQVICFSELTCTMITTLINPDYLMIAPRQE